MYAFILFACLLQISLQLDFIQVQWDGNEIFLSTGQSLQLQVSTVNITLTCSYPENLAIWDHPTIGDRIRANGNRTLFISIFRLAESGNYTCQNRDNLTQQSVGIELQAIGTGLFHIDSTGNDVRLANGYATIEPIGSQKSYICLSSLAQLNSAEWYFPNGSRIDNQVMLLSEETEGISVFDALPDRGVYRLMLNSAFNLDNAGLYQCRANNSFGMGETQNLYIYPNGTGYISVEYEGISTQAVNATLYIPIGTTEINLTCSISNSTWLYPPSQYTSSIGNSLCVSLFTLGEIGTYHCVGELTVNVVLKANGSAITSISRGIPEKLTGHEVITYIEDQLEVLCLSSNGFGVWYHPIAGRIDSEIAREEGSIRVKQNISTGVTALVFEGELSSKDEGVYRCVVPNQQSLLSVGIYNGISYITVESYPYSYQVYNGQILALPPARESIVLSCPYPNDVWSLPANSNTSSCTLPDGRIYISQLDSDSEGIYSCANTSNTSITILQATQELVITVNGELFNQSLITVNSCALPLNITCSLTSLISTPLVWLKSNTREVVSYSIGIATIDTSMLRSEDSGVFKCATDTLGYAATSKLEIRISEANYVQLEYGSRAVSLVDRQVIDLDLLSLAVFLTCKGSLPYWSTYPPSNYTHLTNNSANELVIDILSLNSIGDYVCSDNVTGDSTTITIGSSLGIGVYQKIDDGSYNVISEAYPVVHLNNSQYVQLVCVTSVSIPCLTSTPWYTQSQLTSGVSTVEDCGNREYHLTLYSEVLVQALGVEYSCVVVTGSDEELVRKVAIYRTVSGYIHVYYDYTHYDIINNTSLYLPLGSNDIILDCNMYFNTSDWLSYPNSYTTNNNGKLVIGIFSIDEVGEYSCTDNDTTVSIQLLPKATSVFSLTEYTTVPNNAIFTPREILPLLCLTAVTQPNITGWFSSGIFYHNTQLNITESESVQYFSCIATLDGVSFDIHNIRILPGGSGYIHIEQFGISMDIPSSGKPIVPYGTQGVKISCSLKGLVSWRYPDSVENSDAVCLVEGGILISNISSETRGTYYCTNNEYTISISLRNVVKLTATDFSTNIAGYEAVYLRVFSQNITLICDSPNTTWLLRLNQGNDTQIISTNYTTKTRQINGSSIEVSHDSITIGSLGIYESGYYTCGPNSPRQTIVYLQSIVSIGIIKNGTDRQVYVGETGITFEINSSRILISCITATSMVSWVDIDDDLQLLNNSDVLVENFFMLSSFDLTCSDPGYPASGNATVIIETTGLALLINVSSTPSQIRPNSVFILSPSQNTSFTCVYGSLHQPPQFIHTNFSNATVPLSSLVQTQLSTEKTHLNILMSPQFIYHGNYASIRENTALNGHYSCVISPDNYITFTVYHKQTVTPKIRFFRNSSPVLQQELIRTPYNNSIDLLECRANLLEPSLTVDRIDWWFDGIPITSDYPILNISALQNYTGLYECRVYSLFGNASRTINISILRVPSQPLNLTALYVSSVNTTLSWTRPEFSYGTILSYLIVYTVQTLNTSYTDNTSSSVTEITLRSLIPNSVYSVSVSARNSVGSGPLSESIYFQTLSIVPNAPESFTYSRLTLTSVQLTWIPPRESSGKILYYQISATGSKSYDLLYQENLDPLRIDSSSLWVQLEDLTPATYYTVSIVAVADSGISLESASTSFITPPGEISVESPVVVTTPLRGLDSIVVSLDQTSDRNAEITFQLLVMVQLPLDFDTTSFEIAPLLSTLNLSRTPRDAKNPLSVIQLSFVANISTDNCYAFPNYFIVGGNLEFNTCNFSKLLNKVKVYSTQIHTNYYPELQFGFQYAFALIAVTKDEIFHTSAISNFLDVLLPVNDGVVNSIVYIGAALGAAVVLFVSIIISCCFILCCLVNYYTKSNEVKLKRHDSDGIPTMETSLINAKTNLGFSNPLATAELALNSSEMFNMMRDFTQHTYSTKTELNIPIQDLGDHIQLLHKNNNEAFTHDYNQLDERMESEAKAAKQHSNRHLNRFVDVFPYDDSRVVLTPIPDFHKFDHDYINASFIDGYTRERSYIVTQAPLLDSICDFWRLCWEYNVTVITYFTDSIAKIRNSSYWPENVTTEAAYGPFTIKLTEMIINRTYIRRVLIVKHQHYPDETRKIHQFHFISWPDTGFPEISSLLNFHTLVKSFYISQDQSGPLLVHCRSGTGPSAVFLSLDILLAQAKAENRINIQKCINSMRSMRAKIMCSLDYYIFSHDLLLTALTSGDTCIDAPFIPRYMKQLLDTDNETHSDGYHNEYTILEQISIPPHDYPRTISQQNACKNRNNAFLPINCRIVKLKSGHYINATFLNGYSSDNSFIIAESPLDNTIDNFWHLIFESRCHAVVMLCDLAQEQTEVCAKYWMDSGEPVTYGHLTVQLSNIIHPEHGAFTIHTFALTSNQMKDSYLEVKQYIYHEWNGKYLPSNYCNFVKLITELLKGYHGEEDKNPILIHCSDTVGRSGALCCALYCIERLIEENVVDVFGCVRFLRSDKPGLVNTEAYYRSIYETILSYISN